MKNPHTSQHLYAILADTDSRNYYLEQPLQEIYFQEKKDEICGIADHILVVGYDVDGKDHDDTL